MKGSPGSKRGSLHVYLSASSDRYDDSGLRTEERLEVAVETGYLGRCDEGDACPAGYRSSPDLPVKPIDAVDNDEDSFNGF